MRLFAMINSINKLSQDDQDATNSLQVSGDMLIDILNQIITRNIKYLLAL